MLLSIAWLLLEFKTFKFSDRLKIGDIVRQSQYNVYFMVPSSFCRLCMVLI